MFHPNTTDVIIRNKIPLMYRMFITNVLTKAFETGIEITVS